MSRYLTLEILFDFILVNLKVNWIPKDLLSGTHFELISKEL